MVRTCSACNADKPLSDFWRAKGKPKRRCKACDSAAQKSWRDKNRDALLAKKREYVAKNAERHRAYNRSYAAANKEATLARTRAYFAANPQKRVEHQRKREAKRLNAVPSWFDEFDELVMAEAADLASRRAATTGFSWHVDHIVPLTSKLVSGLHCAANIQVIPAAINTAKGNRVWPDMW